MTHKYRFQELLAQRLIREKGIVGQLSRNKGSNGPSYNPIPVGQSKSEPDRFNIQCMLVNFKEHQRANALVKGATRQAYISTEGLDTKPKIQDVLEIGDFSATVLAVEPLSPANTPILWKLTLKD